DAGGDLRDDRTHAAVEQVTDAGFQRRLLRRPLHHRQGAQLADGADEFSPFGLAVVLEPVGQRRPRQPIAGRLAKRREERLLVHVILAGSAAACSAPTAWFAICGARCAPAAPGWKRTSRRAPYRRYTSPWAGW